MNVASAIAQEATPFQKTPLNITVQEKWSDESPATRRIISFPQYTSTSKAAAQKINFYLQEEVVGTIAGSQALESVVRSCLHEGLGGEMSLLDVSDTILRNDGSVFSVEIWQDALTAYPSSFTNHYSFDSRTGDRITKEHLFTDVQVFEEIVRSSNREQVIKHIKDIRKEDYGADSEYIDYIIEDLVRCGERVEILSVEVLNQTIRIDQDVCLPHAARAIDMDWVVDLPVSEVSHLLTEYGKSLFGGPPVAMPYRPGKMEVYTGTIGKLNITMVLHLGDTAISGGYYYNSRGEALTLEGEYFKDEWTIKESDGSHTGTFTGVVTDLTYEGTWRSADGKRSLPFRLRKG